MAKKKDPAKWGAGVAAAGKAVRSNEYVQRIVEDEALRDNLREAFESAQKAYERMSDGRGPINELIDDKKVQRDIREAASSLREVADTLRGAKGRRKRKRRGGLLVVLVGGGVAALAVSEGLRKKVLDLV